MDATLALQGVGRFQKRINARAWKRATIEALPKGKGKELPGGWCLEHRLSRSGRNYTVFHGPNGAYAESYPQAWRGGKARRVKKPSEKVVYVECYAASDGEGDVAM